MNEDREGCLKQLLAHTESCTPQELEDEVIDMLSLLVPYPIAMWRQQGLFVEEHGFSGFVVTDEYEEIAYSWELQGTNGIRPTFITALYEALCDRTALLQRDAESVLEERAEQARREQARQELIREVQVAHRAMVRLFDGARVERVIRRKSFLYYRGQLMHILGDFTLHGLRHRAWYTIADGWCEIPVDIPLNRLDDERGTIGL